MRRAGATLLHGLIVWALIAAGCGSRYGQLVSEDRVPALAALKQEHASRQNHTVPVPTGPAPHLHVAIHQIDNPRSDSLVVFIHGIMADSSAWRFVAADVARDHDLWLIDLPGCGESDKPDPDKVGAAEYSPAAIAGRVLEALQNQLESRIGGDVTLVAHSLGGAIAIRMYADDSLRARYGPVLSRIDRMVLISPLDVAVHRMDPLFHEIATTSSTKLLIGSWLGLVRDKVAQATIDSVCSPDRALREEADKRIAVLTNPGTLRPTQAMLSQATAWKGLRPDWDANELVARGYRHVEPPVLILWGERDETLPFAMGCKLARELPRAELLAIPRVMHSPHIEEPELTARVIREYIRTGKAPTLPGAERAA